MNRLSIITQLGEKFNKNITDISNPYTTIENVCAYLGLNYDDDESNFRNRHTNNFKLLKDYVLHRATDEQIIWLNKNFLVPDDIYLNSTTNEVFVGMVMNENKMPDYKEVQTAISSAITKTGNYGYACNKSDHLDDMTVEIFDNIRACKFAIFDFTTQNEGAYYEAGYAKAIGKQVIHTCRESEMSNLHFDINHLRAFGWETYEDLEQQLIDIIVSNNLGKVVTND